MTNEPHISLREQALRETLDAIISLRESREKRLAKLDEVIYGPHGAHAAEVLVSTLTCYVTDMTDEERLYWLDKFEEVTERLMWDAVDAVRASRRVGAAQPVEGDPV